MRHFTSVWFWPCGYLLVTMFAGCDRSEPVAVLAAQEVEALNPESPQESKEDATAHVENARQKFLQLHGTVPLKSHEKQPTRSNSMFLGTRERVPDAWADGLTSESEMTLRPAFANHSSLKLSKPSVTGVIQFVREPAVVVDESYLKKAASYGTIRYGKMQFDVHEGLLVLKSHTGKTYGWYSRLCDELGWVYETHDGNDQEQQAKAAVERYFAVGNAVAPPSPLSESEPTLAFPTAFDDIKFMKEWRSTHSTKAH